MSEYDIEKMTDIIDIRSPKQIDLNLFEIILFIIILIIIFSILFFLWKKIFANKKQDKIIIPQINIYDLKSKELSILINKLNKYIKEQDIDNSTLTLTSIIKIKKEIELQDRFLHMTTKEFTTKINMYNDILNKLDKHKYGKQKLNIDDIKNIKNNILDE